MSGLLSKVVPKIVLSESAIQACNRVRTEVFAHLPQLNMRTGHRSARKQFTGEYIAADRYYHASMTPIAKKFYPDYVTEEEERRLMKNSRNRRRGVGPPKKGQGKRAQKKKKTIKKKSEEE